MEVSDGLPVPRRYRAVAALTVGLFVAVLSSVITNVALPAIGRDIGTTAARSIWIINAFQIAMAISLLPVASLGDAFGYARVFRVGLVVFVLASLGCAASSSLTELVIWRVLQGLGCSGILGVSPAMLRFTYPRSQLGRGLGINSFVVATTSAIGPTIAAGILAIGSWHWLFAVSLPLGIVAFLLAHRALPDNDALVRGFDVPSALLNACAFAALILSLDGLGHGAPLPLVVPALLLAIGLGYVFIRRQRSIPMPMLPLDFFKSRLFSLSVVTSFCSFGAQAMAFVALPFYFQDVLGRSQVDTGLLMTPWPVALAIAAPTAGRLSDRFSAGLLGGIGLTFLCAGLVALALLRPDSGPFEIGFYMVLCGAGFGLFQTPNNRILLGSVPRERSGAASGLLSTTRVTGQTLGAALVGIIFSLVLVHATAPSLALFVAAGVAGTAALVSLSRLRIS